METILLWFLVYMSGKYPLGLLNPRLMCALEYFGVLSAALCPLSFLPSLFTNVPLQVSQHSVTYYTV